MSASGPVAHPRRLALPQRDQRRFVARAGRGGRQSQQGAALCVVQLALRRHGFAT